MKVGATQGRKPRELRLASLEKTLGTFFSEQPEVVLAYLFGSYVNRAKGPFHDIDIAVFVMPDRVDRLESASPYGYTADLTSKLAHLLKYAQVDFVLLNQAPPLLLRQVIGKGKLVFCRSETARIRFEIMSLKRHADTTHIRKIKRYYMNERIEKGMAAYA